MANFLRLYSLDFSWKIFPLGRDYRTVVIFSFLFWKYYFLYWLSLLLIWNQLSTNCLFSLSTYFLSLEFYSFTVEYPVLHFFSFILIWIHLASWIYCFVPFIGFRKFLANGPSNIAYNLFWSPFLFLVFDKTFSFRFLNLSFYSHFSVYLYRILGNFFICLF